MSSRFVPTIARVATLALVYFVTGRLGLMLPAFGSHITLVWLPSGIAVAALLRCGFVYWPGVALGAVAVNLAGGVGLLQALSIAVGNTAGPLLAAWSMRRAGFHPAFDRQRDILILAAAAMLGMLLSASIGVSTLAVSGGLPGDRLPAWLIWWAGDTMGVVAAAPLLLAFNREEWRALTLRRGEFFIWAAVTGSAIFVVFVLNTARNGPPWALAFLPLPLIAWAALRFGAIGTSLAVVLIAAGAALGTANGRGPLHRANPTEEMLALWLFIATSAVLGWLITAVHAARVKVSGIQRLIEQALSDVSLGVLLGDLDRKITFANAGFTRLTGYEPLEILGKSCRMLQGRETDPAVAERLRAALHGDGFFEGEILNYRKDGSPFWNALLISPVHNDFGERTGFLGIQRNVTKRRETEMALQRSEEHLRTIVDLEPECVKILSPNACLLELNPAGLAMIEATSIDQVRGCPISELIAPEDRAEYAAMHERVMRGEVARGEFSIITLKGTRRWVETHAVPYRDAQREIVGALCITRDITVRKMADIRAASERSVLELLASGAPLGDVLDRLTRSYEEIFPGMLCSILLMDRDGKRLRHGAAPSLPADYCKALDGIAIGPAVGSCGTAAYTGKLTLVENIATDPLWKDFRALALSHGLSACWSMPVISSQSEVLGTFAVYYRTPQMPRPDEIAVLERGAHFVALAMERHRLIRSLQDSRTQLETLVGNLPGMAYRCEKDSHWTMTYVSDGCEAITGYRREELENDRVVSYGQLVHPEDTDRLWTSTQAWIKGHTSSQAEYRLIHKDGQERWVSDRATGVFTADGALLCVDGFIQDITASRQARIEREQFDRKMQETQKLESLGVLAGGIAHDFNNLLTGVMGHASLLRMDLPPGSPLLEYIEPINEAAQRAADLCKQMLAYSGRGRFVIESVDLSRLVEDTAKMLAISISKKAELRFHLEKGLPLAEVDVTQIRQVIMNLVINASEAVGEKSGVIGLSTGFTRVSHTDLKGILTVPELPEGDYVFLEVSDNGCGMSPETQARIFEPFFTTKFTGRGLGLAAVLGIVRGHKGALKVSSEAGRGTIFKVLFPATSVSRESVPENRARPEAWHGQGTVLVVDDEDTVRSTAARMLRALGFKSVLVSDGLEAVEVFSQNPAGFTLVLLDMTMPRMDGAETFKELRRLQSDVRVVLMSGFNQQEALLRFPATGLASFLQKPFNVEALRSVLQAVLCT